MPSPKAPSARVIANRKARVVMNRAALDELELGMADGLFEVGTRIVADASERAPRDPETAAERGVPMMADTGHVLVYAKGKKVAGEEGSTGKPRAMKVKKDQVVLGMWFSSPIAHFIEGGTIKMAARPFFTPALADDIEGTGPAVTAAMNARAAKAATGAARRASTIAALGAEV